MQRGDLDDFEYSEIDGMRRVNVDGLVYATRAVIQGMKTRAFGRIVNLTSIAAHGTAMAGTTFYAATKAAVSILTRRFAMELGPYGITVNAVAPTFIRTPGTESALADTAFHADTLERIAALHRIGEPMEVAGAVVFLASPAASLITGETILIDGGWTAR